MSTRLILLHGALYTGAEFAPLIEALGDRFDCIPHTFAGHGDRPATGSGMSIPAFADEVFALLDAAGFERAPIFGFSMGGYVALHLALHHPTRVERIMTLGTKLRWDRETAEREVRMLDPETIEAKVPRFAETLKGRHGEEGWRGVLAATAGMMTALGDRPDLTLSDLHRIETPVRLSLGDHDTMVSLEETIDAYRALPNAELQVHPATQHPLERVNVGMLARAISDYFGG